MNISHIRYIAEIEKTGSITKAAANLFMGQPNLSKAVRELENELGIKIFRRTTKGVEPTAEGREFIEKAKSVLAQFSELESAYKSTETAQKRLRVSYVYDRYISEAIYDFAEYASMFCEFYEADCRQVLRNVSEGESDIGIVRLRADEGSINSCLQETANYGLDAEVVKHFSPCIVMNENHPILAGGSNVSKERLREFPEIISPSWDGGAELGLENVRMKMSVSGGEHFPLLRRIPHAFSVTSPIPDEILAENRLVSRRLSDPQKDFCDMIVFRRGRELSDEQRTFCDFVKTNCIR